MAGPYDITLAPPDSGKGTVVLGPDIPPPPDPLTFMATQPAPLSVAPVAGQGAAFTPRASAVIDPEAAAAAEKAARMRAFLAGEGEAPQANIGSPAAAPGAAAQVAAPDPYAGLTLQQLMQPVNVGGTGSYSRSEQTTMGLPPPPKEMTEQLDAASAAQGEALRRGAEAQSAAMRQQAAVHQMAQAGLDFEREKAAEDQAKIMARAEELDADRLAVRQQIREHRVDASRAFSGAGGIVSGLAMALAAGMEGFVKGYRGDGSPNSILQLMNQVIDRDVAIQEGELQKLKEEGKDLETDYGRLRQQYQDRGQALTQYRLMANEDLASNLARIAAQSGSEQVKQNAAQAMAVLKEKNARDKVAAWQAAQNRTVISKTSGGTTIRKPLGQMLAARAQAGAAGAEKLPKTEVDKIQAAQEATAREDRYVRNLMGFLDQTPGTGLVKGAKVTAKSYLPGSKEKSLMGEQSELVGLQTKAISGASATEEEFNRNRPLYPGPFDSKPVAYGKLINRLEQRRDAMQSIINAYPGAPKAAMAQKTIEFLDRKIAQYGFEAQAAAAKGTPK